MNGFLERAAEFLLGDIVSQLLEVHMISEMHYSALVLNVFTSPLRGWLRQNILKGCYLSQPLRLRTQPKNIP